MPLKEPDLKDADTYKKASRMDLPKVASGKAKFWIYKDVELPNASGKKQKYPAFLVLVDDNGVRKALTGKKLICKGTCGMKEERIAFDPSSGAVPYKVLKVSIPLLLGKAVWVPTGKEDTEEEEDESESESPRTRPDVSSSVPQAPPPPQGPPPLTAAALTGAWTKLVKDVQAYCSAHPERKEELSREMAAIAALLKANKAAEAKTKMDKVRAVLDAPPAPTQSPESVQVAARWSALVKQMQAALAANPQRKAELMAATSAIPELIRAGKLDLASKQMEAVEASLKENPREKEFRTRYRAIETRLAAALKNPASDASALRAMDAFVVEKSNARDFETALKALLRLEAALAVKPPVEEEEEDEGEEAEDEEEKKEAAEFQKDVKGRMVAAMAQVRARAPRPGQEPKPQLQFMAYLAGKNCAVIVAKKVGSATKKILAGIAGVSGGKIVRGECVFENGVHTFVPAKVPSGLAKKLTVALLAETGTRYRVRVRSMDGSVDLDSETDVDPDAPKLTSAEIAAAWQKLVPEMQQKSRVDPAVKDAAMRARSQMEALIKAGKLEDAQQALENFAAFLAKAGTEQPKPRSSGSLVEKRKFLIERWQKIPPQVSANLKALQDVIAREMPEEDAAELVSLSEDYLDDFYEEMKDAIDDDINSGDAQYKGAIASIHGFREKIASEPLIQHLKANPLNANIDIESILLDALSEVEQTLSK